jgi:hypothetical protein
MPFHHSAVAKKVLARGKQLFALGAAQFKLQRRFLVADIINRRWQGRPAFRAECGDGCTFITRYTYNDTKVCTCTMRKFINVNTADIALRIERVCKEARILKVECTHAVYFLRGTPARRFHFLSRRSIELPRLVEDETSRGM